jgi:hypothetical protein
MIGLQTLCGLIGPVAECRNDAGNNQSEVCSVKKFCNFSLRGALLTTRVSAVEAELIVTICSTCGHAALSVWWPGPCLVCI